MCLVLYTRNLEKSGSLPLPLTAWEATTACLHVRLRSAAVPGRGCWSPGLEGQPLSGSPRAGCLGKAPGKGNPPHSCGTWGPGEEWRGCKGNIR